MPSTSTTFFAAEKLRTADPADPADTLRVTLLSMVAVDCGGTERAVVFTRSEPVVEEKVRAGARQQQQQQQQQQSSSSSSSKPANKHLRSLQSTTSQVPIRNSMRAFTSMASAMVCMIDDATGSMYRCRQEEKKILFRFEKKELKSAHKTFHFFSFLRLAHERSASTAVKASKEAKSQRNKVDKKLQVHASRAAQTAQTATVFSLAAPLPPHWPHSTDCLKQTTAVCRSKSPHEAL
jgi:hypothetical protein